MKETIMSRDQHPQRRVWAQDVCVGADALLARLDAIETRTSSEEHKKTIAAVRDMLTKARAAATGRDPIPLRLRSWWRGTLIEAAYQNLHAAEAEIVMLYSEFEVDAEFPEAVARIQTGLSRDDPRFAESLKVVDSPLLRRQTYLRKYIEIGHSAADHQHSRLRSFRNIILTTAALIGALMAAFILFVWIDPDAVPLCFLGPSGAAATPGPPALVCPAGDGAPAKADVVVVAVLGLLGGALSAAYSIRNLKGTSTPYDIPVALSCLKVTAGALTAVGAIIAIRGSFVPGLSDLDSQSQILAYALLFGYAQQLFTGYIDRQAQGLLDVAPGKESKAQPAEIVVLDTPRTSAVVS
jgi:hypothetical protein